MGSCGVGGAGSRGCGVSWVAVGWEGQDLGGVAVSTSFCMSPLTL